jgi:hypothetical protein
MVCGMGHLLFIRIGYLWLPPTLHVVNKCPIKTLIIIYHQYY